MRELFEKEIAALAVRAGAILFLKTKVTKLVRKDGKVVAVETNSSVIPRALGQIFICADGIRSTFNGFAVKERLCQKGEIRSGKSYLLANSDVSAGIIERFTSPDPHGLSFQINSVSIVNQPIQDGVG